MPIDPQARALLDQFAAAGFPALETLSAPEARVASEMLSKSAPPGPEVASVRGVEIPGQAGRIPARVYLPQGAARGLIVYYHGGGWVLGDLDSSDALVRNLVHLTGCAAVSVDYRLAPEHPFPAAVEDAVDALVWCAAQRRALTGADVPLILAGDSAGANLAAVTAILDRDAGHQRVALQLLLYPVTDAGMDTPSYRDNGTGLLLTQPLMAWFWKHYVADARDRGDNRCSPLRAADLSGLPPAFIQTAEYDPLRDEGEAYARRLAEAGVAVTVQRRLGMIHGYAGLYAAVTGAQQAMEDAALAIRRYCAVPGTAS